MSQDQHTWIGRTLVNRYQIESLLGQGGMSSVYLGMDMNLKRTVAVKIVHPYLSEEPEFIKRFEQEAAAVAQLRHPNIIQVHDFNKHDDAYFMILEHVKGETLDARLSKLNAMNARLPLQQTATMMATLCNAVAYAHDRNMIHRDLKPSNVMVTPQEQVILMDFGIAKIVGGESHTATGASLGTAAYMAPEQVMSGAVDHRVDVYALGVMLYEMVGGQRPFEGDSAVAIMMKHINEPVPDIRLFNNEVPEAMVAVINKALAKDPDERFQSAYAMGQALQQIAAQMAQPSVASSSATTKVRPPESVPPTRVQSTMPSEPVRVTRPVSPASHQDAVAAKPFPKTSRRWQWLGLAIVLILAIGLGAYFLWPRDGQSLPPATDMVRIPAGTYTVGLDDADEQYAPAQAVTLTEYWLDKYEVTNHQYMNYVIAEEAEPPVHWTGGDIPSGEEQRPIQGITWEMAANYCEWADKRLPSEAEWEVAARGRRGLLYPWGDEPDIVPISGDGSYDVGTLLANQSGFGLFDMAGNVWEWVGTPYGSLPEGQRLLKGGAYNFQKDMAYRLVGDPTTSTMFSTAGFRCAADAVQDSPESAPLVQDDFTDPASGWLEVSEGSVLSGYHPPDYYHVQSGEPDHISTAYFGANLDNLTIETDVFVDSTDSTDGDFRYGVIVRRTGDQFYAFTVSPRRQAWYVLKGSPEGLLTLAEGNVDTLEGLAQTADTLRVDASGENFDFAINDRVVTQFRDTDYSQGDIGFFVQTFDETRAHIHYDLVTAAVSQVLAAVSTNVDLIPTTETIAEATATATIETTTAPPTESIPPTATATAVPPTDTPVPPTETPIPVPEGMVLVTGGSFLMGSTTGEADELPEHPVTLDSFFIDQFEVSSGQYRLCVEAGQCTNQRIASASSDHPVVGVSWDQATAYCAFAGGRLPTEAEWEYAASGPDNNIWPWGNDFDPSLSAASSPSVQVATSFPEGASPFGALNMAGNVAEWVQDLYDPAFYANSPVENPVNLESGSNRIYRGGSFGNTNGAFFTTSRRFNRAASFFDVDVGFRCAADLP